jgi:hypothetical protein
VRGCTPLLLVLASSLYVGVPSLQDIDSGSRAHLGKSCEPTGGANFSVPRSIILNFLSFGSYLSGPLAAQEPKIFSLLLRVAPWEALLEVWERLPLSCLLGVQSTKSIGHHTVGTPWRSGSTHHQQKNVDGGPLGGGAGDLGAPTINVKNIDGRPPGRRCQRSESTHHQP